MSSPLKTRVPGPPPISGRRCLSGGLSGGTGPAWTHPGCSAVRRDSGHGQVGLSVWPSVTSFPTAHRTSQPVATTVPLADFAKNIRSMIVNDLSGTDEERRAGCSVSLLARSPLYGPCAPDALPLRPAPGSLAPRQPRWEHAAAAGRRRRRRETLFQAGKPPSCPGNLPGPSRLRGCTLSLHKADATLPLHRRHTEAEEGSATSPGSHARAPAGCKPSASERVPCTQGSCLAIGARC